MIRTGTASSASVSEAHIKPGVPKVGEGNALLAINPYPPTMLGYNTTLKSPPRDLDKARALLKEAGVPEGTTFTLFTRNGGGHNEQKNIDVVRSICALLEELGGKPAGVAMSPSTRVAGRVETSPCSSSAKQKAAIGLETGNFGQVVGAFAVETFGVAANQNARCIECTGRFFALRLPLGAGLLAIASTQSV